VCDWAPDELLGGWRDRVRPDLERLGAVELRAAEDGWKATLEVKSSSRVASITAWSTGMLELISLAIDQGRASDPEVITEQRESLGRAGALLDEWLQRLIETAA
jgi:hypothetical protein